MQAAAAAATMVAIDRHIAALTTARLRMPETFCRVMNNGAVPPFAAAAVATAGVAGGVQS